MNVGDLNKTVHLRLTEKDMTFLTQLAEERSVSVSECIRQLVGEYRRSLETMEVLKKALEATEKGRVDDHGDAIPHFNN